jgi:hypothetical protein
MSNAVHLTVPVCDALNGERHQCLASQAPSIYDYGKHTAGFFMCVAILGGDLGENMLVEELSEDDLYLLMDRVISHTI